ncbi:twin-arginine translocase subunit TatC [Pelagibius sp.]|uniref:twin-arginine translocase subunit TatC n=1 Tax=Pelagibius sp. TaxID=1931238 RepID=UPI002627154B|nr:twin-arginine translocase subunit TatC [Pelagibius sp.]
MTTATEAQDSKRRLQAGPLRRVAYCSSALLVVFLVCFFFAEQILGFLLQPVLSVLIENNMVEAHSAYQFTSLKALFGMYATVALFAAAFLCFPFILYQFQAYWAGRRREPSNLGEGTTIAVLALPLLLGGALAYYVVFPFVAGPIAELQGPGSEFDRVVWADLWVEGHLYLLMKVIAATALCFVLPAALFVLSRVGKAVRLSGSSSGSYE